MKIIFITMLFFLFEFISFNICLKIVITISIASKLFIFYYCVYIKFMVDVLISFLGSPSSPGIYKYNSVNRKLNILEIGNYFIEY